MKKPNPKRRLRILIESTAREMNLIPVIKNYGIDTIAKIVREKNDNDIFGEWTMTEKIQDSILEFAL